MLKNASRRFSDRETTIKKLLLIHGLIQNGILVLCLKKRWNIQYKLYPSRNPIAIPFEVKSVLSKQAEFGHLDIAILFTYLAFYYSGVTPD